MSKLFTDYIEFENRIEEILSYENEFYKIKRHILIAINRCFCPFSTIDVENSLGGFKFNKILINEDNIYEFMGIHLPHIPYINVNPPIYKFAIEYKAGQMRNRNFVIITVDTNNGETMAEHQLELTRMYTF